MTSAGHRAAAPSRRSGRYHRQRQPCRHAIMRRGRPRWIRGGANPADGGDGWFAGSGIRWRYGSPRSHAARRRSRRRPMRRGVGRCTKRAAAAATIAACTRARCARRSRSRRCAPGWRAGTARPAACGATTRSTRSPAT